MPEMFEVQIAWYENLVKRIAIVKALKKQLNDQKEVLAYEYNVMDKIEDTLTQKMTKINNYMKEGVHITEQQRDFLLMRSLGEPEEVPIPDTAEAVTRKIRQVKVEDIA